MHAYANDSYFTDETHTKPLNLLDGMEWRDDVNFAPDDAEIKQLILKESYDSPYAGHMGVTKTRSNIQRYFTWQPVC